MNQTRHENNISVLLFVGECFACESKNFSEVNRLAASERKALMAHLIWKSNELESFDTAFVRKWIFYTDSSTRKISNNGTFQ